MAMVGPNKESALTSILSLRERRKGVAGKKKTPNSESLRGQALKIQCPTSNSDSGAEDSGHYSSILPSERPSKSLQSCCLWEFNGGMKIKILICAVVVGWLWGCAPSTETIKGTVCSCTDSQITVLEQDGTHYDIIQRTASTIITPPVTPPCSAGTPVTVQCASTDAQRKEGPCPKTTQTPPSS